jgi:hypothetical protein
MLLGTWHFAYPNLDSHKVDPADMTDPGIPAIYYRPKIATKRHKVPALVWVHGRDFTRDPTNPIFRPHGEWNCGRAIDAEVIKFRDKFLLYFATRDPDMSVQMMGVAAASGKGFGRESWRQLADFPILKPELPWEQKCVEGASVIERGDVLYMFYAGAYNNKPQQIGVAKSTDGITWTRLSNEPFLPNGKPGMWNSSESGHPHIFEDADGRTWLFYQGNDDQGKTWFISNREIKWNEDGPYLAAEQ